MQNQETKEERKEAHRKACAKYYRIHRKRAIESQKKYRQSEKGKKNKN